MRTIFIIFILSFLVACSPNESGKTSTQSKERLHRIVKAKKNIVVGKSVKAASHAFDINPFLTKEEEAHINNSYDKPLGVDLSAIFYSPPNSKVVIDGRILKEGDRVNNKTIKEIKPKEVILKDSTSEHILNIENTRKISPSGG